MGESAKTGMTPLRPTLFLRSEAVNMPGYRVPRAARRVRILAMALSCGRKASTRRIPTGEAGEPTVQRLETQRCHGRGRERADTVKLLAGPGWSDIESTPSTATAADRPSEALRLICAVRQICTDGGMSMLARTAASQLHLAVALAVKRDVRALSCRAGCRRKNVNKVRGPEPGAIPRSGPTVWAN